MKQRLICECGQKIFISNNAKTIHHHCEFNQTAVEQPRMLDYGSAPDYIFTCKLCKIDLPSSTKIRHNITAHCKEVEV